MSNKQKFRFNGIDLMVILLIIGCIAGLILRNQFVSIIRNDSNVQSAKVSFFLNNIRSTSEDYFEEGDEFFIAGSTDPFGTLQGGFTFEPTVEYHMKYDGIYVKSASVSGRSDMHGSFIAEGTFSDTGEFLLNGSRYLAPGSEIAINSDSVDVSIMVTDIVPIS